MMSVFLEVFVISSLFGFVCLSFVVDSVCFFLDLIGFVQVCLVLFDFVRSCLVLFWFDWVCLFVCALFLWCVKTHA